MTQIKIHGYTLSGLLVFIAFWFLIASIEEPITQTIGKKWVIIGSLAILLYYGKETQKKLGSFIGG